MRNQQNLDKYPIRLVVLRVFDNRFKTIVPHVAMIQEAILYADDSDQIIEIDLRGL